MCVCVCVCGGGGGRAGLHYCKKQSPDSTGDNHQLRKRKHSGIKM